MPSRAVTSFLQRRTLCVLRIFPYVSMPSRAVTSFLRSINTVIPTGIAGVNALSGCYLISTIDQHCNTYGYSRCQCPLGLLPHFYKGEGVIMRKIDNRCQCPLGLLPHFYHSSMYPVVAAENVCQCPLGLLPHFYMLKSSREIIFGKLCQCPLGLLPHFYT